MLLNTLNVSLGLCLIPSLWKEVKAVCIPKVGKIYRSTVNNYRPIRKTIYREGKFTEIDLHDGVRCLKRTLGKNSLCPALLYLVAYNNGHTLLQLLYIENKYTKIGTSQGLMSYTKE